jgi:hypothetical protein
MKKIKLVAFLAVLASFQACGGGESADNGAASNAKTYCECIKMGTPDCMKKIEDMEAGFKKDPKSFDAFMEEAVKVCPDAKDVIEAMKPM